MPGDGRGATTIDRVDVAYRWLGRTRHATLDLDTPLGITTADLGRFAPESVVDGG